MGWHKVSDKWQRMNAMNTWASNTQYWMMICIIMFTDDRSIAYDQSAIMWKPELFLFLAINSVYLFTSTKPTIRQFSTIKCENAFFFTLATIKTPHTRQQRHCKQNIYFQQHGNHIIKLKQECRNTIHFSMICIKMLDIVKTVM